MKSSIGIFQKIRDKFKYGLVMGTFLNLLGGLGLAIRPYYVFQEGLYNKRHEDFELKFKKYETTFLCAEDLKEIECLEGRTYTETTLRKRLEKGNKCFAVKMAGKIVGFTWSNFDVFDHPPGWEFKLKGNEAYLFDAYILKAYRGLNLAPFMRWRCIEEIRKMGRCVFYSYTDYFNTPAIRFKNKIGAQPIKLCLYIQFGERFHWHCKLKTFAKNILNPVAKLEDR